MIYVFFKIWTYSSRSSKVSLTYDISYEDSFFSKCSRISISDSGQQTGYTLWKSSFKIVIFPLLNFRNKAYCFCVLCEHTCIEYLSTRDKEYIHRLVIWQLCMDHWKLAPDSILGFNWTLPCCGSGNYCTLPAVLIEKMIYFFIFPPFYGKI